MKRPKILPNAIEMIDIVSVKGTPFKTSGVCSKANRKSIIGNHVHSFTSAGYLEMLTLPFLRCFSK